MIVSADQTPIDRPYICRVQNADTENFLTLGACSYIGDLNCNFYTDDGKAHNVLIGRFSSLASKITFNIGLNHAYKTVSTYPFDTPDVLKKIFVAADSAVKPINLNRPNHYQIIIGHDVWIGNGATIMGGVKIGNGAVIGAEAIVAKDIPPYAIAVGNPARVIKYRFSEEIIRKLLAVKWWNWDLKKIADNLPLMTNAEKFLAMHYSPDLEDFPEDNLSRKLGEVDRGGIYQFIADFRANQPLWKKIIKEFVSSELNSNLIVWLGKEVTKSDIDTLNSFGATLGYSPALSKILFVPPLAGRNFLPLALRRATHFISTREMATLEALDYLWNTDVKIVSALDADMFKDA